MNYKEMFEASLKAEGITGAKAAFARSINHQESGGGVNTQTSNAGAEGGMQIIPGTFAAMADKGWDIKNPEHNARAGIRYAMQMFDKAEGNPAVAAAGYYGGPGGLEKARKGIAVSDPRNPNAPTTLQYGQQVAARMGVKPKSSPLQLPDEAFAKQAPPVVVAQALELPVQQAMPVLPVPPVEQPIQVAAAPNQQVTIPAPQWNQFQNAMPVAEPLNMDYSRSQPQPQLAKTQPNFTRFKSWLDRA